MLMPALTPMVPMEPFRLTRVPVLEDVVEDDPVFRVTLNDGCRKQLGKPAVDGIHVLESGPGGGQRTISRPARPSIPPAACP